MLNPLQIRKAARAVIADIGEETLRSLDDPKLHMTVADVHPGVTSEDLPAIAHAIRRILNPIHGTRQESAKELVNKLLDSAVDEVITFSPPPGRMGEIPAEVAAGAGKPELTPYAAAGASGAMGWMLKKDVEKALANPENVEFVKATLRRVRAFLDMSRQLNDLPSMKRETQKAALKSA